MKIADTIRVERKKKELTQAQLAEQLFVSRQFISKWETGKGYPDLEQVGKLSEIFDLSIDTIIKGDNKIVTKLTLDTKRKKWLQALVITLFVALIILISFFTFTFLIEGPVIQLKDLKIVNVKKKELMEKTVRNKATGQIITIPADVSYEIKVKTSNPFLNLNHIKVYKNQENKQAIQVTLFGQYGLWWNKKESIITIPSSRMEGLTGENLNIYKNIYLWNKEKSKITIQNSQDETIEKTSDLFITW